jgi:ribosomal protein S12 methylthiotransferase accessory factor
MEKHDIKVTFGGGLRVNAEYKGFVVQTDQPVHQGGGGTAPSPFDYFLISLATCAGFYALEFCQERKIPVEGLDVSMNMERGAASKMIEKVTVHIGLPTGFPPKYTGAIVKAVDLCAVKAHILKPPQFEILARLRD